MDHLDVIFSPLTGDWRKAGRVQRRLATEGYQMGRPDEATLYTHKNDTTRLRPSVQACHQQMDALSMDNT